MQFSDLPSLSGSVGVVDRDPACTGRDNVERAPRFPLSRTVDSFGNEDFQHFSRRRDAGKRT